MKKGKEIIQKDRMKRFYQVRSVRIYRSIVDFMQEKVLISEYNYMKKITSFIKIFV
jgi:hypothetical protein